MKISSFLAMAAVVAGMATACLTMTSCAKEDNAADEADVVKEDINFDIPGGPTDMAMPGSYIVEAKLLGCGKDDVKNLYTKYTDAGWKVIEQDLNQGAGGKYIYLTVRRGSLLEKDQYSYITDFYLSNKGDQPTLNVDGHTYIRVENDGDRDFDGNLNSKTKKGDNIFLYYTKEILGEAMAVTNVTFDDQVTGNGVVGREGQTTGPKNNVAFHGYNLNAGTQRGSKIYMHLKTEVRTRWKVDAVDGTTCQLNGFEGPTEGITTVAIPLTFNGMKVTTCSNIKALEDLKVLNYYDLKNFGKFPLLSDCMNLMTINQLDEGGNVMSTNVVPDYITTIGDRTFQNTAIESIELPGVTEVGVYAFRGCNDLKQVVFGQPAVVKGGAFSFIGSGKCEVIYPGTAASWDNSALLCSPYVAVVGKSDSQKPAYWGWCGGNSEGELNGLSWHLDITESKVNEDRADLYIACAIDDYKKNHPDNQLITNHGWEAYCKKVKFDNLYLKDVVYVGDREFYSSPVRCVHLYPSLKKVGTQGFLYDELHMLVYHGTQQQWNAMEKADKVLSDTTKIFVHFRP